MPFQFILPATPIAPGEAINTATDFARFFAAGSRPASDWAVGAELELIGFTADTLERLGPQQIQAVIRGFDDQISRRVVEHGYVTEALLDDAAARRRGDAGKEEAYDQGTTVAAPPRRRAAASPLGRLTLEPGGQVEFSGAAQASLVEIERGLRQFTGRLAEIAAVEKLIFVTLGFDPLRQSGEQRWIPKARYQIMRPYLKARGARAWDMMCRTAAIQVNLDYSDLEDLARKFQLATRLAPVAAAMFANSPFENGKLSGYKSTRYRAWLDTDPDRTGPSPVGLGDDFSIERFVDYVAGVPMFFVRREGDYIDLAGHSFSEYLAGCGCPMTPIFQDFTDHLTTIFTEARLKPHIEQRSMDCGSTEMVMGAMAFWKGLMYDQAALQEAMRLAPRLTRGEYAALQLDVARRGLDASIKNLPLIAIAGEAIEIARAGLQRIAAAETPYLDLLEERVTRERLTNADILIRNFEGTWHGDIRKAIADCGLRIAD
ncbi:MAG TPA: glutamate-cysteine ligase family protein [Blastocatellia bacterium]|nr:glutamate-cysteine ligase family protein [Blastocatellia bacterium]